MKARIEKQKKDFEPFEIVVEQKIRIDTRQKLKLLHFMKKAKGCIGLTCSYCPFRTLDQGCQFPCGNFGVDEIISQIDLPSLQKENKNGI